MNYKEVACEILDCEHEEIGECLFIEGDNGELLFPDDILTSYENGKITPEITSSHTLSSINLILQIGDRQHRVGTLNVKMN